MKRVRDAIIWMTLLTGITTLLFFSVRRKENAEVKTLVVKIDPIDGNQRMLSEAEITRKIEGNLGFKIEQVNIRKIDIRALESVLNEDPRIDKVDVYFDSKDRLTVWIRQRKPIMRVVDRNSISYYLDAEGAKVPTIVSGAVRVPLVTGDLEAYSPDIIHSEKKSKLKDVFEIMKYVHEDAFLSALIEQIHVEEGTGEIFMIPKIGREKLIFGGAENMEEKFDKLKIFYRDGLPRLGWSKYSALNLKVTDQVVCTLR